MSDLSDSNEWATPRDLFAALEALYGPFDVDVAAAPWNAKCEQFFTLPDSALERSWRVKGLGGTRAWDNPPYKPKGTLALWMAKARAEVLAHHVELVTNLIPHSSAEAWWHEHVECAAGRRMLTSSDETAIGPRTQVVYESLTVEVLRIRGRQRFQHKDGKRDSARFASVAVTFAVPNLLVPLVIRRRPGPKTVVTPEIERAIRSAVDAGASIVQACEVGGIARKTWYRFLERKTAARPA